MSDDAEVRAQARVGDVLNDKWTLERLIGVGGMAAVYAGRHRNGARAAVKLLHSNLARISQVRERFLREGYAANRVEHRGAVKVLDDDIVSGGPDDGTAYLVMELLDGESLQDRAERAPPLTEREFLTIARAVLEVLEAAHAHGVVHRDLKPENLFLARDEDGALRVKVLDFGLARLMEGERVTGAGLALGTPSYMSPEQAAGRTEEIDGRTDLFAVGATGFRLLTGKRIHEGDNPVEVVTKMAKLPAPPIRDVAPSVSERFARVIDRALAFRREDRYPDAAAMRADVEKVLVEYAGEAATVPAFAPISVPLPAAPPVEPTQHLSEGDLEPVVPPPPPPPRTKPPEPASEPAGSAAESESESASASASASESVPLRRARRSSIPLVTCLLYGAIFARELYETFYETKGPASVASTTLAQSDERPPVADAADEGGSIDATAMEDASPLAAMDFDDGGDDDGGDDEDDEDAGEEEIVDAGHRVATDAGAPKVAPHPKPPKKPGKPVRKRPRKPHKK